MMCPHCKETIKADSTGKAMKKTMMKEMIKEIKNYLKNHSIRDLARLTGKSKNTISKISQNKSSIKNKTIIEIYEVIQ